MFAITVFSTGVGLIGVGVAVDGLLSTILIGLGLATCLGSGLLFLFRGEDETSGSGQAVQAEAQGAAAGQVAQAAGGDAMYAERDINVRTEPDRGKASLEWGGTWTKREFIVPTPPNPGKGEWADFIGLYVINRGAAPAHNAWAQLDFSTPGNESLHSIEGRWSHSPTPSLGDSFEGKEFTQIDIPPNGKREPLDVAARFESDGATFAFNSRNLFSGGRHDIFSLDSPEVVVGVEIQADGGVSLTGEWWFSQGHFELRPGPTLPNEARILQFIHSGRSIPEAASKFYSRSFGETMVRRWTQRVLSELQGDDAKGFLSVASDNGPDALDARLQFLENLVGLGDEENQP